MCVCLNTSKMHDSKDAKGGGRHQDSLVIIRCSHSPRSGKTVFESRLGLAVNVYCKLEGNPYKRNITAMVKRRKNLNCITCSVKTTKDRVATTHKGIALSETSQTQKQSACSLTSVWIVGGRGVEVVRRACHGCTVRCKRGRPRASERAAW